MNPASIVIPEKFRGRLALKLSELGELTGLSGFTLRGEIERGALKAKRIGGGGDRAHYIVNVADALAWLSAPAEPGA
jgi:hypothetical protein